MPRKPGSITALNRQAAQENWRGAVGDLLSEEGVRGVVVTVFYEDRNYMIRQVNVMSSDLALLGAKLLRMAVDD
jgi:hypothetical protein